jgi:heme/copper-type cytochrome/quinol oxidase subunit 3
VNAPVAEARASLDVSSLPSYAFGHRSLMWWATLGVVLIEGTVFALAIVAYFYIRTRNQNWPPGVPAPDLLFGTLNTLIMMASGIPNEWTRRRARAEDLRGVRIGMFVCLAFAAAFLAVRAFEFRSLNVAWDTNAYGSATWMLLGLHTVHLVTDALDTIVLAVLMVTGPIEGKRFVDVSENAEYWWFVILAWLPIYFVIYLVPHLWPA